MVLAVWPVSLPQSPLLSGYRETESETVIRTEMDAGPAKIRQRFQAGVGQAVYPTLVSNAQKDTLITFYRTTLLGGSLRFTHTLPNRPTISNLRFLEPPAFRPIKNDLWATSLAWEILP